MCSHLTHQSVIYFQIYFLTQRTLIYFPKVFFFSHLCGHLTHRPWYVDTYILNLFSNFFPHFAAILHTGPWYIDTYILKCIFHKFFPFVRPSYTPDQHFLRRSRACLPTLSEWLETGSWDWEILASTDLTKMWILTFLAAFGSLERISWDVQSGRSCPVKHGDAYFSAVYGFMKDLIAAPGPYENQEC